MVAMDTRQEIEQLYGELSTAVDGGVNEANLQSIMKATKDFIGKLLQSAVAESDKLDELAKNNAVHLQSWMNGRRQ